MAPLSDISVGKEKRPRRIMLYGTPGIGKSTFAAAAPKPIFLQTEEGLADIDCSKYPVAATFEDVMKAVSDLYTEKHAFQTIVVDSLDWLEKLIWSEVCRTKEVKNIEDIGYGRGFGFAMTHWNDFLTGLSALREEKDMTAILIAHSKVERFEDPEGPAYDRYSPRIHKTAGALIQGWADEILFASYKVLTRTEGEGFRKKTKGMGTGERVIRTVERPAFQAKNRLCMPDEIPLTWSAYASFFESTKNKKTVQS